MNDPFDADDENSKFDLWRLCDELNIVQAALLVAGHDPSHLQEYVENYDHDKRPIGYEAAISSGLMRV